MDYIFNKDIKLLVTNIKNYTHWITTRDGLYVYNLTNNTYLKVLCGNYFGFTKYKKFIYIFGYEGNIIIKNYPTFNGFIIKLSIDLDGNLTEPNICLNNLDNGTHQIMIVNDKLYILETYMQRIAYVNINENGDLNNNLNYIYPFENGLNANYVHNYYFNKKHLLSTYYHINAFTYQDGYFYVLYANSLRNSIEKDNIVNIDKGCSVLNIYNEKWEHIKSISLGKSHCHDLVMVGYKLYFLSSSVELCYYDLARNEIMIDNDDFLSLNENITRGLSINNFENILFAYSPINNHVNNIYFIYINGLEIKHIKSDLYESPTYICSIFNEDYNQVTSELRKSYVLSIPSEIHPIFKEIADFMKYTYYTISQHKDNMQYIFDKNRESHNNYDEFIDINLDKLEPINSNFQIYDYMSYKGCIKFIGNEKPVLQNYDYLINNCKDYINNLNIFKNKINYIEGNQLTITGPLFYYPKGHGMGWHTNLNKEKEYNQLNNYRIYCVYTEKNTISNFIYLHPYSKKVHVVPDYEEFKLNLFSLRNTSSPFWHSVSSENGDRLSFGIAFNKKLLNIIGIDNSIINKLE